jgi:glycosyltransferase involved in cell wall biosynthesis
VTPLGDLSGARIVVCNWRDLKHPRAGGAEVYCHRIAEQFAAAGATVQLLTAEVEGAPRDEVVGGVRVHRAGNALTVYPRALLWLLRNRKRVDAVVDCQNGIPFFTPLAVGRTTPVVCVIHHVHQEQFSLYLSRPAAAVARLLEGRFTRSVYRGRSFAVVSPSTRTDARRVLKLRGSIHVVANGIEQRPAPRVGRTVQPRIAIVGRLVPHKRVDYLLESLRDVRLAVPGVHLDVIGDGPARAALERRTAELGLEQAVTFHGFVDDETKRRLVAQSWLTAITSLSEGWGLTIIEAAALGIPAVGLDVAGVRDAIRDHRTGWLVRDRDELTPALVNALRRLGDPLEAQAFGARARAWAASFSWRTSAEHLAQVLLAEGDRLGRDHPERRSAVDVGIRMEIPLDRVDPARVAAVARRTDRWRVGPSSVTVLLPGADEDAAAVMLERLEVAHADVEMHVARPLDYLFGTDEVLV